MLFDKTSKVIRKQKKLQMELNRLFARLDNLDEEYGCIGCVNYDTGNVIKFADRYAKCDACEYGKEMKMLAEKIDYLEGKLIN